MLFLLSKGGQCAAAEHCRIMFAARRTPTPGSSADGCACHRQASPRGSRGPQSHCNPNIPVRATVSDIAGVNARRVCMTAISCKAKKHTTGNPHEIWVFQLNCKNCGFCSFGGFFGVCGDIPQARWRRRNCLSPPPPSYSSMSCSST